MMGQSKSLIVRAQAKLSACVCVVVMHAELTCLLELLNLGAPNRGTEEELCYDSIRDCLRCETHWQERGDAFNYP